MSKLIPLPRKTRAWVVSRLRWTDSVPTAAVSLTGTYNVFINRRWWDGLHEKQRRAVLLHELAHVYRGDCPAGEGRDPHLWNIATDAAINRTLTDLPQGAVDYGQVCLQAGLDPNISYWTARLLYDRLAVQGSRGDGSSGPLSDDLTPGGDPLDHVREKASLDDALQEDGLSPDNLPASAPHSAPLHRAGWGAGTSQWTPQEKGILSLGIQLHRILARHKGRLEPCRTWRRAGRIRLLRGSGRQPEPSVGVYVDLSGSTADYWNRLAAIARGLRQAGADIWVYDDGVRRWDGSSAVDAGGGTVWAPVAAHIEAQNYGAVVICTDGYFADSPTPLTGVDVTWVITPGGRAIGWGNEIPWPK